MSCYSLMTFIRKSRVGLLSTAALASLLVACGGGGDGGAAPPLRNEAASPVTPAPASAAAPSDVLNAYPAGSEELAVYTLLNAERNRCGFGLLEANAQLDAAARGHTDYQLINSRNSHLQDARVADGFTGTDPEARVRAQGYANAGGVTDEYAFFTSNQPFPSKTGLGGLGMRALLNAPYHLNGLMSGYRDVGIAVRSNADTGRGARGVFVQLNAAYKANVGPQLLGSTDVKTYPCDGATGINRQLSNESPNPVPGRDLGQSPLGSTVYIAVREGNRLTINSAFMKNVATGQNVILRVPVTSSNDPYGPCASGCFKAHQGYIVADAPLQANTVYSVSISGANNGAPFTQTFTFTTGS